MASEVRSFSLEREQVKQEEVGDTSAIVTARKLRTSVKSRPWILDDHIQLHLQPLNQVIGKCRPELAHMPSLEEAPVFRPTEEEFKDALKYVASILPRVRHYGLCRIVPPSSWKPPCLIEEETTGYVVDTHVQRISDLHSLTFMRRLEGAHKKEKNKRQKILSRSSNFGCSMNPREFVCCEEHFEFDSGPKFTLKSFKNHADHFKRQYFCKEDQSPKPDFSTDPMQVLSEPSIPDIEREYWRIIENPTKEVEVLQGKSAVGSCIQSGFPHKNNLKDVTGDCPQYVESGWNLNNTPKLQDSLLRFESSDTSSILLPRLSVGMCFSSDLWRIEDHHLYLLSYIHFGAPRVLYGVPGSYRCKFEESVMKHLPASSVHPSLLHNLATQLSPSTLSSEGMPVYRCVQNPKEFVVILPGTYHAQFDSGFNCSEAVNFAPFDWLPHGQTAVELYSEQGRKTSISHDKLLVEAATEALRGLGELNLTNKNSLDNFKWTAICQRNGILTKALKARVASEVKRRKYVGASLESRKMENICATTKMECRICFYDLFLSAVGCQSCPDKYACLLHAKQLCGCAWSEKYMLVQNGIDELNTMVDALDGNAIAVQKWVKEKLGLPVSNFSKNVSKDGGVNPTLEMAEQRQSVISGVELSEGTSHSSTSRAAELNGKSELRKTFNNQQDEKAALFAPSVGPGAAANNSDEKHGLCVEAEIDLDGIEFSLDQWNWSHSRESDHDEKPSFSQDATGTEKGVMFFSADLKKKLAEETSSTARTVIILSDDEN